MAPILDIGTERFKYSQLCKQQSYSLIGRMFRGDISFEEFQDGCHDEHLGYRDRMIFNNSESLCSYVYPKFLVNWKYGSKGDVI